nr:immunoglobulin heavy chain junction region [Mus musculus]MBK4196356.1 immunoglobulin heavy chain junction region [Mus musculus]
CTRGGYYGNYAWFAYW